VLTDFSPTASEAIGEITDCHAFTIFLEVITHLKK
jgi:hypothetical protein